jgi:hypothetical protein
LRAAAVLDGGHPKGGPESVKKCALSRELNDPSINLK